MSFEWDIRKADANFKKHGVTFSESLSVFEDDRAVTITDNESNPMEQRFVSIGAGAKGRVLVVVYCFRGEIIRIISVRPAQTAERSAYGETR